MKKKRVVNPSILHVVIENEKPDFDTWYRVNEFHLSEMYKLIIFEVSQTFSNKIDINFQAFVKFAWKNSSKNFFDF